MSDLLIHTTGIVLRTVPYGDTSIIVTIFTQKLGIKAYMINGIRTQSKKGATKFVFFQPGAILDLIVYNNEFKNLNRLKEYKWSIVFHHIYSDIVKNSVCVYIIELFSKVVKETEPNDALYDFLEDSLKSIDHANALVTANFPVFFTLQLAVLLGFMPQVDKVYNEDLDLYFDLVNATISNHIPQHVQYIFGKSVIVLIALLHCRLPEDIATVKANSDIRNEILDSMQLFYRYHIDDFMPLKTLPVLRAIFS